MPDASIAQRVRCPDCHHLIKSEYGPPDEMGHGVGGCMVEEYKPTRETSRGGVPITEKAYCPCNNSRHDLDAWAADLDYYHCSRCNHWYIEDQFHDGVCLSCWANDNERR